MLGNTTVAADNSWSIAATLTGQGVHSLVAKDADAAGNVGSSSAVSYNLDPIAPTVAISSTGGLTNSAAQTVSGTGEAGTTVTRIGSYAATPIERAPAKPPDRCANPLPSPASIKAGSP